MVAEISRTLTFCGWRAPIVSISPCCTARKQLHLHLHRQVADLVKEQRAAVGIGELAGMFFGGAGKGALLMAEENAFDQIVRDGAAIDGDERLAGALAGVLDGAGDHFLADAGFAFEHDRNIRLRGPAREIEHPDHRRACRNHVVEANGTAARPLRYATAAFAVVHLQRVGDRNAEAFGRNRLDDEIEGAGLHGENDGLDAALPRLHDDRRIDAALGDRCEEPDDRSFPASSDRAG